MAFNWLNQVFNFVSGGVYASSPTPIGASSSGPLLCDANGRLIVCLNVPNGPVVNGPSQISWVDSAAYAGTGVIKASPGTLYQLVFQNDTVAASWVHIFDKASAPITNDVPKFILKPSTGVSASFVLPLGRAFTNGISWGLSSSGATFNAVGSPLGWFNAQFS